MSNDNLTDHSPNPKEGSDPVPVRRLSGCLKLMLLGLACVILLIVGLILLIDSTNSGDKVKKGVVEVIDAARGSSSNTAPADQPEIVEKVVEKVVEVEVEKIVEVEKKEPLPSRFVERRTLDTAELWNGLTVETTVQTKEGAYASSEREREEGFRLAVELQLTIPKPSTKLAELAKLNPELPKLLPDLGRMLKSAKVSPFYHALYEAKTKRVQQYLTRLDRILSRHNFFDCETVLELTHPDSGQRALLIQSEMDVVSDGSDGDRWPELDNYISMSDNYRYSTSYAWPKQSTTPNPLLAPREAELKAKQARFAVTGLSIEENRSLREDIDRLTIEVGEMKIRSFLIAEADPFVVIPLSMLGRADETPFGPMIGDYVVVFYGGKAFPAIAGDAGPTFQAGEASLRLAKALNERAGVYSRPESDLKSTYLVFPQSAEKEKGPPDLVRWRETCDRLLGGLGGLGEGYQLHQWEDLIAQKRAASVADEEEKEKAATAPEPPAALPVPPEGVKGATGEAPEVVPPSSKAGDPPREVRPLEPVGGPQ